MFSAFIDLSNNELYTQMDEFFQYASSINSFCNIFWYNNRTHEAYHFYVSFHDHLNCFNLRTPNRKLGIYTFFPSGL